VFGYWLVESFEFANWLVSLRKDEVVRCRGSVDLHFGLHLRGSTSDKSWIRCKLTRMLVAVHTRCTCVVCMALGI